MDYPITVDGRRLEITCVSIGNPHAVVFLKEPVTQFPLERLGPLVEHHPLFPQRVNFSVANVVDRKEVRARVWERGAGLTMACGTSACAIAVAARLHGLVEDTLELELPGGRLQLEWDGESQVLLTGPAELVFVGDWPGGRSQGKLDP
jgi:diaminopimelate epimerase